MLNLSPALLGAACALIAATPALAQTKPEDTEAWKPLAPIVAPAALPGGAPADAIILFDESDLSPWISVKDGTPAAWPVAGGVMTVDSAQGNIETKRAFGDYQLHLEWRVPADVRGSGQGRGNSGVFLASTGGGDEGYEVQILDSFDNPTYVNGQAASVYKQHAPLANASRKPGEWQTYDIVWRAPKFAADGALVTPAIVTVIHNGVLVQDHVTLAGETTYIGKPRYRVHGPTPIKLQAHGAAINFRNIWLRELAPRP